MNSEDFKAHHGKAKEKLTQEDIRFFFDFFNERLKPMKSIPHFKRSKE